DAAAQERALERAVTVHAASSEAGDLAGGPQAWHHGAVGAPDPTVQVGLDAAEGLARDDVQPYRDEGAGAGVEDLVRRCGAGESFTTGAPAVVDGGDLQVLGERVVDLAVARHDLTFQVGQVDEVRTCHAVHACHEL